MTSTLNRACDRAAFPASSRLAIDGVSVDDLFEFIYCQTRDASQRFDKPVRFDIISGSCLTIAADFDLMCDEVTNVVRWCLALEDLQRITISAYPCHDDVWAIFDLQVDLRAEHRSTSDDWKPTFMSLRSAIEQMGGEWELLASYRNLRRITFRLPQWVTEDIKPRRLAHALA